MAFPILDIGKVIIDIAGRFIPDPQKKMEFQLELQRLLDREAERAHQEMMGQIGTNTEEAKSTSMFVAGWRPAVGWIGAVGLGYSFVLEPFISWIARVVFSYGGSFPTLDTGQLMALITGMLGFGTMRAYEKVKGVPDSAPLGNNPTPTPSPIVLPKKKVLGIEWPF